MEIFANRLKELRNERKLNQRDFAKILGISQGSYARYELGWNQPSMQVLVKIADFFGVTTDYLLGREEY